MPDGSAGYTDYGRIGPVYADYRQPDPRIAASIESLLGDARTVLNVGAGTGSYEPRDRALTAVEPSSAMRARRSPSAPTAIDATAENLPFEDKTFDASMATFTVHQWSERRRGLQEMRRITRGPVVILTGDPELLRRFWLYDYAPDVIDTEARRYPPIADIAAALGGTTETVPVPIPCDCVDGFNEAYYARPERLLDPAARLACSAWSFVDPPKQEQFEAELRRDLDDGTWDRRYGELRGQPTYSGSLAIVRAM